MISLLDYLVCSFFSAVTVLIIAAAFALMVCGEGHVRWFAFWFLLPIALTVIAGGVGKFMAKCDKPS